MKTKGFIILSSLGLLVMTVLMFKTNIIFKNKSEKVVIDLKEDGGENKGIAGALDYYKMIKADPTTGTIDPEYVRNAWLQADKLSMKRAALGINWQSRGPDNIGGRMRGIQIDKDNPAIIYASGVSGGFFKSTSYGSHWVRIPYAGESGGLIISSICQTQDGTLYFGTGESQFCRNVNGNLNSGFVGGGIYKSIDRGETWTFLTSTNPATNSRWSGIQGLVADPIEQNKIYAATLGGLYYSNDGGSSFTSYPGSLSSNKYIDVRISTNGQTLYAVNTTGMYCKVYRSIGGASLTQVGGSVVSINAARSVVAISPSNPDYVYVSVASTNNDMQGIYQSKDNGYTWGQIVYGGTMATPFGRSPNFQGDYDHCIAVDPYNENKFYLGGVDFYTWDNGFWYKSASLTEFLDNDETSINPRYIHADKHIIVFDTVTKPYKMYVGTDGGITVSDDAQFNKYPTFKAININLHTTQFYAFAVSPQDFYILGGTQDNGSMKIAVDGFTGKQAKEVQGGDGFYAEISRFNPNYYFTESQEGAIMRSSDKGKSIKDMKSGVLKKEDFFFNTPFRLWEDTVRKTNIDPTFNPYYDPNSEYLRTMVHLSKFFVVGAQGLWLAEDATDFLKDSLTWFLVSKGMSIYPTCIEYTSDGDVVFVGGTSGSTGVLYRISGLKGVAYKNYNYNSFNPSLAGITTELIRTWPNQTVTGIGVSPGSQNNVVVALGNYSNSAYKHVYICKNALAAAPTFSSIQGDLPYMPVYDGAIHSLGNGTDTLMVATELGMYSTINGGNNWFEENLGMDRVPTFMIRQLVVKGNNWQKGSILYYVGTHGLGIYSTEKFAKVGLNNTQRSTTENLTIFPNPASDYVNMKFNINQTSDLNVSIYNLEGRLVKSESLKGLRAGDHVYHVNTEEMITGTYMIMLNGKNTKLSSRLLIVR